MQTTRYEPPDEPSNTQPPGRILHQCQVQFKGCHRVRVELDQTQLLQVTVLLSFDAQVQDTSSQAARLMAGHPHDVISDLLQQVGGHEEPAVVYTLRFTQLRV